MHQCLSLNLYQTGSRWALRSAGKTENVPVQAKIISNQMSSLLKVALTDGGVALIPTYLCRPFKVLTGLKKFMDEIIIDSTFAQRV